MNVTKIDVMWNFVATFFKIASAALLLPVILKLMPPDDVGIWSIFSSITALIILLDFGFNSSFTRNITYVFSGVRQLKATGFETVLNKEGSDTDRVDYGLLKGMIASMRWYYSRVALLLLALLLCGGTFYINTLLKNYHGNKNEVLLAWLFFCLISTYNLYTLYYDALLEGRGLIKIAKQIIIVSQVIYLTIATVFIVLGLGLLAIVMSQIVAVVITRYISYRVFFNKELKQHLRTVIAVPRKTIIKAIYPNATKYGITSLGGFMIQKSAIFIGSVYLSLSNVATFGITKQLLDTIVSVSAIAVATYFPKITKFRVESKNEEIKNIYIRGSILGILIFMISTSSLILLGNPILALIGSRTRLANTSVFLAMALSSFIGLNTGVAGATISTRNEIPFVKASILSGIATVIVLLFMFRFTSAGLLGMALTPGLVDLCYQGWKWPLEVIKEFKITFADCAKIAKQLVLSVTNRNL